MERVTVLSPEIELGTGWGWGWGGHMAEHVRTSLVSLLWQCTALTPIFGLTPQPCFGCRLSTERAGLPGNISALKQSCTHPRVHGRFSFLKRALGVEHPLKGKWTVWREDGVLTMRPQGDYTVAHTPRPQNANQH